MPSLETCPVTPLPSARRLERARAIAVAGSVDAALAGGSLPAVIDTTVAEALVIGLLRQGVRTFFAVLGHGSTEVGEVLRLYEQAGVLRTVGVRSEISASHAAMALRWVTGEKAAVVTSIGPGALQAMAASLAPASDGVGVWYLFGDETTHDEGPNMQQIPKPAQNLYLQLGATLADSYCLHTPGAVSAALRRGLATVDHAHRPGPFFLLLPINTQPSRLDGFHLHELPAGMPPALGAAGDEAAYAEAVTAIMAARRVVVKAGGGARQAGDELARFCGLADAVAVLSPLVTGLLPHDHPRNMLVGGSKGSICGNYAMGTADLLVTVGTRAVCQSDCSRTGYPEVQHVVAINTDAEAVLHYNRTTALLGDAAATLRELNRRLEQRLAAMPKEASNWLADCRTKKAQWQAFKAQRYARPRLPDPLWDGDVLTQPAVIKLVTDWARQQEAVAFFDAGDVQANGFQVVEDDRLGRTYSETGASYMGFAASALLATAVSRQPFYGVALTGDGSLWMNPQVLVDGAAHGATGCLVVLDNRRMGAISSLQRAQYGTDHATSDGIAIDYVAWAGAVAGVAAFDGGRTPASLLAALDKARQHKGLSLVHVPVYFGDDPLGGLGAWGRWNVGNWVDATQALAHELAL
jgi:3D-(3,5/4)-trihydroxycyclohexane-1,2-dione acylhydrolase (decyclizing)